MTETQFFAGSGAPITDTAASAAPAATAPDFVLLTGSALPLQLVAPVNQLGKPLSYGVTVAYSVDDTAVANVAPGANGQVDGSSITLQGIAVGTATLTVAANGATKSFSLAVQDEVLADFKLIAAA